MNISFFLYKVIIALSMASSSQKRHKTRKGKAPTQGTGIEEVLDYSRYFSTKRQMMVFEKMFHSKPDLSPKAIHSSFFFAPGFQFQKLMNFQGLQPFLGMKLSYYEDFVRLFYTNIKITPIGDLSIKICSKRIHIN